MKTSILLWVATASLFLATRTLVAQDSAASILSDTNSSLFHLSDTNAALSGTNLFQDYSLDDKHKLAPGDKVSFRILEDSDPSVSLTVTDSGELAVPYLNRVKAAGMTCKQLAHELKTLLEQKYYYHATVVVGLDEVSKTRGRVYVLGQVRNQGPVDIPSDENFTVGKAILAAGGFGDFANKRKVKLIPANEDGSKQEPVELNMEEILEKGKTDKDKPVHDGDFIIVPSRLFNM